MSDLSTPSSLGAQIEIEFETSSTSSQLSQTLTNADIYKHLFYFDPGPHNITQNEKIIVDFSHFGFIELRI